MFHRVMEWKICDGTTIEAVFQDGVIKRYDLKTLFVEYPQFTELTDRALFEHPQVKGAYLLVWNDELDLGSETVYMEGETIGKEEMPIKDQVGAMITEARWSAGLSQSQLGKLAKVDQADVSKLEVGEANPTITTLERIARAMGKKLKIAIE